MVSMPEQEGHPGENCVTDEHTETTPSYHELDAEVIEPLTEAAAGQLDTEIRVLADATLDNMNKIRDLLAEAKVGQIHVVLGFQSWPAYVADALTGRLRVDSHTRKEIVAMMAGEGMSERAIAKAVAVSQSTVNRDLAEVSHDDSADAALPDKVDALDGKQHPRRPKPEPMADVPKPRRNRFTDDIGKACDDMRSIADRIVRQTKTIHALRGDDRYPQYRNDFENWIGNAVVQLVQCVSPNLTAPQRDLIATWVSTDVAAEGPSSS
jgi:hypothetical protein